MKFALNHLKYLISASSLITSCVSFALTTEVIEEQANISIKKLYHTINRHPNTNMAERINWFSDQLKGTDYFLGSLGEGPNALYDQYPRYRVDAFDCDTYVNTVLSLALANSLKSFQMCINNNRYANGQVDYIARNHFTELDWNTNNQNRGVLKDITATITDEDNKPVALTAEAVINKPGWYAHKTIDTIRLENKSEAQRMERLNELKEKGALLSSNVGNILYLPFSKLFENDKPNRYLFQQIPQGAIIEIVRPNWDLRDKIGTALNVSHLGFAIWINNALYFREASSQFNKVVDVPLIDYLNQARKNPTIQGINVQIVLPEKPSNSGC